MVIVPLPSWPPLAPQQYARLAVVTPHVWDNPALTDGNLSPPETATGTVLLLNVPLPSPKTLLAPQQYACPPVVTPHAKLVLPALTDWNRRPPETMTGTLLLLTEPLPSSPLVPCPSSKPAWRP